MEKIYQARVSIDYFDADTSSFTGNPQNVTALLLSHRYMAEGILELPRRYEMDEEKIHALLNQ